MVLGCATVFSHFFQLHVVCSIAKSLAFACPMPKTLSLFSVVFPEEFDTCRGTKDYEEHAQSSLWNSLLLNNLIQHCTDSCFEEIEVFLGSSLPMQGQLQSFLNWLNLDPIHFHHLHRMLKLTPKLKLSSWTLADRKYLCP